jgi:ATP-dependent Clp protease ATP-binding subunit ClpA
MMFERFSGSARAAVFRAQESARSFGRSEIGAEHLLLGTIEDRDGIPATILGHLGVDQARLSSEVESFGSDMEALSTIGIDLDEVRRRTEETFGPGALNRSRRQRTGLFGHRTSGGHIPFTVEARAALQTSLHEAVALKRTYIGAEHLLLGLLTTTRGTTMSVLRRLEVALDQSQITAQVVAEMQRRG